MNKGYHQYGIEWRPTQSTFGPMRDEVKRIVADPRLRGTPRPDLGIPGMWLRVGALQLHFVETDEMPTLGKGFPHYALHVPTDRFDETIEALRAAGAPSRRAEHEGGFRHDGAGRLRQRPGGQFHRAHQRRPGLNDGV